ncbi:hypothetical protein NW762_007974 [Fusarium torreyae]|uniref:NmrA-like domain-containing protein n=1 Tax=Fusarium torreyae TaxID=1237075 RepID=A0A9W8RY28_9HYPO|nr:hypothetical protein NW762_007974 [Fusarium torreyae]
MSIPILRVAVVGATGRIGSSIVPALVASRDAYFEVTALIRPESMQKASTTHLKQKGIKIVEADLQGPQEALVSALDGIDVVICVLPPDSTSDQIPLVDAALKAGVKRFVPNMWATLSPPRGVMRIRNWMKLWQEALLIDEKKEDVFEHIKKVYLPYTIIDIGFWHEVMIPRIDSGRLDHVALYSKYFFVDDGSAACATTHIDDVGPYVACIISDPGTINRMVFAYGEVVTQHDIVQFIEDRSGEKVPLTKVTSEQISKAIESGNLELWPQVILEYGYNAWSRGDNDPKKTDFLGYLDAKDLYPNFQVRNIRDNIGQALQDGGVNPGFGNEEKCSQIFAELEKWK